MPKDYLKKAPTKLEQNINFQFNQIYQIFKDMDARLTAITRAKFSPEAFVKFLLEDTENLIFREKLKQALDAEIAKRNAPPAPLSTEISEETKSAVEELAKKE